MSAKTFVAKLYLLVYAFLKYVGRWRDELSAHLTAEQKTALDNCLDAAIALADAIRPTIGA